MAKAADKIGTMMFVNPEDIKDDLKPYIKSLIPCLTKDNYNDYVDLVTACTMVELSYEPGIEEEFSKLRAIKDGLFISVGVPLKSDAADIALKLAQADVDTIHYYADNHGREVDTTDSRFIKDALRDIHLALIDNSVRLKVNIIVTGGIAMAEHVNKAIICGADGVTVDNSLLIAMECRMCYRCKEGLTCPAKLEDVEPDYGSARITNLMGAWRNQMLEMLGAMGIREARRLRGEVGRSMWFEDLEKENFAPIFGERKAQISDEDN
jgi:hypothetical protein